MPDQTPQDPATNADGGLVYFGEPVKVVKVHTRDDGMEVATLRGPLVVFSGPDSPDLEGDYFTADTDFGTLSRRKSATVPSYYQHGFDPHFSNKAIGDAELSMDDFGVWAEYQLELRSEYERHILAMAEAGKMGQSSGAVAHLVERQKTVKGEHTAYHFKSWPIGEASLTPTPAEPRTSAMPLKAFKAWADNASAQAGAQATADIPTVKVELDTSRLDAAIDRLEAAAKAESLDARSSRIRRAFHAEFGQGSHEVWAADVYEDAVIGSFGEDYFRIPYTESDGEITFADRADWQKVREEREWVEAKARRLAQQESPPTTQSETAMSENTQAAQKAVEQDPNEQDTTKAAKSESKSEHKDGSAIITLDQIETLFDAKFKAMREDSKPGAPKGLNTGAPAYIKNPGDNEDNAFVAWVRSGDVGGVKHLMSVNEGGQQIVTIGANPHDGDLEGRKSLKASNNTDMNIGTDADGGHAVPTGHLNQIIARRDESMLASSLGVRTIPGVGTTVNVPLDAEDDGEFVETGEAVASDRDAPALGQKALTLKVYTKQLDLSYELLRDEASNILTFISDFVGRGMAKTHNNLLLTEVAANGSSFKTFDSATAIAAGEIEDIESDDDLGAYLDDASVAWVMRNSTLSAIRSITGNDRLYADPASGGPNVRDRRQLLGYDVFRSNKADAIGASNKPVYFGNWFYVGMRAPDGMQFLRDPYSKAVNRQVRLHYYFSTVYGVLQSEAIGFAEHPTG